MLNHLKFLALIQRPVFILLTLVLSSLLLIGCSSDSNPAPAEAQMPILITSENMFADGPVALVSYDAYSNASEFEAFAEYKKNESVFDAINISAAWAKGANGNGTIIGIMDTEVYDSYEFIGKNLTHISQLSVDGFEYMMDPTKLYGEGSHGTAVAAIAAGNFDAIRHSNDNILGYQTLVDDGIVGVAYGATIVDMPVLTIDCAESSFGCAPSGSLPSEPYTVVALTTGQNSFFEESFKAVLDQDAKFINMSWGFLTTMPAIWDAGVQSNDSLVTQLSGFINGMAQSDRLANDKSMFVISTGNYYSYWSLNEVNYGKDPTLLSTLSEIAPELEGLIIAAAALWSDNDRTDLSYYSNRCGIAQDYCVAAPGTVYSNYVMNAEQQYNEFGNYIPAEGNETTHLWRSISGTSFAAPIITGALAVIDDYFNGSLSAVEVGQRLLITADNTTCPADICGRGIINVGAALDPIGQLSLKFGDQVQALDSWGTPLAGEQPLLEFAANAAYGQVGSLLSIAMSDNSALVIDSVSNQSVMFLDALNAPFYMSFDQALTINRYAENAAGCEPNCHQFSVVGNSLSYSETISGDDYDVQYLLSDNANQISLKKHWNDVVVGFGLSWDSAFVSVNKLSSMASDSFRANTLQFTQDRTDPFVMAPETAQEDVLTLQVVKGLNAVSMDVCVTAASDCSALQYEFSSDSMNWLMRLTSKEQLAQQSIDAFGIQLHGALGYAAQTNKQQTLSLGYQWQVNEVFDFSSQFDSMDLSVSERDTTQQIMHSADFRLNQLKVNIAMTWHNQVVLIGFKEQLDTKGHLSYNLPSARDIAGVIEYQPFNIQLQPRADTMITAQYHIHGNTNTNASSKLVFALDYLQSNSIAQSAASVSLSYPLY